MTCTADTIVSSSPSQAWKIVLAYDGTDFRGWQVQPGTATVQGTLAHVLRQITGEDVLPQGSGRTDKGVHAAGQVVSVDLLAPIPAERLLRALNQRLPSSIRVLSAQIMSHGFHARTDVANKTYEYRIFPRRYSRSEERICPPWLARFAWDCPWPMSLPDMQAAAAHVIGTHDFTSFAAHDPDRSARLAAFSDAEVNPITNVRTIFASSWQEQNDLLVYRVTGTGFLHHMVRNMVGTFVEVGARRCHADTISQVLASQDRRAAGPTAPPQGLFLVSVTYRTETQAVHAASPQDQAFSSNGAVPA